MKRFDCDFSRFYCLENGVGVSDVQQKGVVLISALIMLLLTMVLAIAGMRAITLEARITANLLDQKRLEEVADGALREGERKINAYGVALTQCASGAKIVPSSGGVPCFVSNAMTDANGLDTSFVQSDRAEGFSEPYGYWYPRYINTVCPKGSGATSALGTAVSGCTEYYEVNSQATMESNSKDCGEKALCLRSAVSQFIS